MHICTCNILSSVLLCIVFYIIVSIILLPVPCHFFNPLCALEACVCEAHLVLGFLILNIYKSKIHFYSMSSFCLSFCRFCGHRWPSLQPYIPRGWQLWGHVLWAGIWHITHEPHRQVWVQVSLVLWCALQRLPWGGGRAHLQSPVHHMTPPLPHLSYLVVFKAKP